MLFDEEDSELLKQWIVKKLEDVSDADSDVLADYVLALVKTDDPEPVAKASCVENLQDFLGDSSAKFVDDVFTAIKTKAYDPSKPIPKPPAPTYQPPRRASHDLPRQLNESRKRSYHDWDRDETQNGHTSTHHVEDRPSKQPRRGRGGRRAFDNRFDTQSLHSAAVPQMMPQMPTPPPGIPAFDPSNPMGSIMAQFAAMTGMPGFPPPFPQSERCRDYDTMGFCARGAQCPYEHGDDRVVVPSINDQYDPQFATLLNVQPTRTGVVETSPGHRGRGGNRRRGGNNYRGGGKRADFSMQGPNTDRSITAVVVEQIPEDKFDEQTVHDFFSQFGTIEDVTLQPYKRLAIVKYDSYDAAKAAYESPKVIFDNRFVKVYWRHPEGQPKAKRNDSTPASWQQNDEDVEMEEDEMQIDPEELAKKQEEAQRRYEEYKKQLEDANKQKQELGAKLKGIEVERRRLTNEIARKTGAKVPSPAPTDGSETDEQTRALKEQLAKLEEEAKSLGIDPDAATSGYGYDGYSHTYAGYGMPRGRGGWRGRPRGRGRGVFNPGFRGHWRGARGGGAVMRLDNRPKTVKVTLIDSTYNEHDEALRQWLLFNGSELATLTGHPNREDVALISFPERYQGEVFMEAAADPNFPLSGKVELSWHAESPSNGAQDTKAVAAPETNDAQMGEDITAYHDTETYDSRDDDRDADNDRWG